ncbi:MAG: HAD-IC family P-type ATPase [Erysipelotrichaceae bacterium]|jgi:cation-transporting ATPase E|nr:HAD-IC family P-type ATPase [Erysipelotrichaceae bacterium]
MNIHKRNDIPVLETSIEDGLTNIEVKERIDAGLINKTKKIIGKSYLEIIVSNVFTFFNLILVVIATLLIIAEKYSSLLFMIVYICNTGIGLYQDIKAHKLLAKLQLLNEPYTIVIRNKKERKIVTNEIVRDDIIILKAGNQIPTDGIVVDGEAGTNESLITGESLTIYKKSGDSVYSGSYIVNGSVKVRVVHVGKDNYVSSLQEQAKKSKATNSQIKKSLKYLFRIIGAIVVALAVATVFIRLDDLVHNFKDTIGTFAGSVIAMVPAGLYLLTSISLTVGVINLAKKRTLVQEFYSLEALARCTTLCLDKTGTITDGTMKVKELVNVSNTENKEIELLIANIIHATKDSNITAKALSDAYPYEQTDKPLEVIPFDSAYKFSGAKFRKGTYVIGALEFLNLKNKEQLLEDMEKYVSKGYRVLVLGLAKGIEKNKLDGQINPIALIVLEDHIREDAKKIFGWFADNGVKIRVISGDNAHTVSEIAHQAGIKDYQNYVSLASMPLDEVRSIALKYTVFGRVSPEQKEVLVEELKAAKEVVAMTGDGVNDILALKKADCSIAMASGADAAKNVSQLVLLDSNFGTLPSVVSEGRRVINNIKRTSSLFLMKTIFAIVLSFLFLITSLFSEVSYPFIPNHFYLWEIVIIGLGAFLLAVEKNDEPIRGNFMSNILKVAIPGAIAIIIAVLSIYVVYANDIITNQTSITSMAAIIMSLLPLVLLYNVSKPLTKYRLFVLLGASFVNVVSLVVSAIISIEFGFPNLFNIAFESLSATNYVIILIILLSISTLYIGITKIIDILTKKRGNEHD